MISSLTCKFNFNFQKVLLTQHFQINMSEEGAHELLVAVVQAFNFKGMKYVYVHCKQEDDSSKHQTYFTMMLEDSDVPVAGETIDLFDGYQIIKKNPRGDCRVPDPNNGGHYFYFHENGKEMSDFL